MMGNRRLVEFRLRSKFLFHNIYFYFSRSKRILKETEASSTEGNLPGTSITLDDESKARTLARKIVKKVGKKQKKGYDLQSIPDEIENEIVIIYNFFDKSAYYLKLII